MRNLAIVENGCKMYKDLTHKPNHCFAHLTFCLVAFLCRCLRGWLKLSINVTCTQCQWYMHMFSFNDVKNNSLNTVSSIP